MGKNSKLLQREKIVGRTAVTGILGVDVPFAADSGEVQMQCDDVHTGFSWKSLK
jgi:hypothetical protein